jgi:hypothetical protein
MVAENALKEEIKAAERALVEARGRRRLLLAQAVEAYFYVLVVALYVYKVKLENPDASWLSILTNTGVIVAGVGLFFVFFIQILTGTTPLVAAIQAIKENYGRIDKISNISVAGFNVSFATPEQIPAIAKDEIRALFAEYLRRSNDAMDAAKRRPNALILAGTVIAFVGLVFFILTLPGSKYGFLDVTPSGTERRGTFGRQQSSCCRGCLCSFSSKF